MLEIRHQRRSCGPRTPGDPNLGPLGLLPAPGRSVSLPQPRYLVESDRIQGEGALGVQAAAARRRGEEQEPQEGDQRGQGGDARHGGRLNAGFREHEAEAAPGPARERQAVT